MISLLMYNINSSLGLGEMIPPNRGYVIITTLSMLAGYCIARAPMAHNEYGNIEGSRRAYFVHMMQYMDMIHGLHINEYKRMRLAVKS